MRIFVLNLQKILAVLGYNANLQNVKFMKKTTND